MTNDEGDGKHRRLNIEQSTSNIGMGDEEWPREGAKDTKNFQIAKDTNRVNMNEVPAGAPEGTAGAAVVPELELNNERTGANDEGCGKHRTLNIQQRTSNIGTRNLECGTNNEATKERRGSVGDGSQSSEVGNQRLENRDQKSEVRSQKSEVRSQRSEGGSGGNEDGGWKIGLKEEAQTFNAESPRKDTKGAEEKRNRRMKIKD